MLLAIVQRLDIGTFASEQRDTKELHVCQPLTKWSTQKSHKIRKALKANWKLTQKLNLTRRYQSQNQRHRLNTHAKNSDQFILIQKQGWLIVPDVQTWKFHTHIEALRRWQYKSNTEPLLASFSPPIDPTFGAAFQLLISMSSYVNFPHKIINQICAINSAASSSSFLIRIMKWEKESN